MHVAALLPLRDIYVFSPTNGNSCRYGSLALKRNIELIQPKHRNRILIYKTKKNISGFGGLEVACWPLVLKFVGSNPAEAVGFFRAKKSSARLPSEGK